MSIEQLQELYDNAYETSSIHPDKAIEIYHKIIASGFSFN